MSCVLLFGDSPCLVQKRVGLNDRAFSVACSMVTRFLSGTHAMRLSTRICLMLPEWAPCHEAGCGGNVEFVPPPLVRLETGETYRQFVTCPDP